MKCNKCNKEKLPSEFYKDKKSPTGLTRSCKECILTKVKGSNNYPPKRRLPTTPRCKTCGVELEHGRHHGICRKCKDILIESHKLPPRKLICEMCGREIIGKKQARFCEECRIKRVKEYSIIHGSENARISRKNNPKRSWARGTINTHSLKHTTNLSIDELVSYVKDKETCEICGRNINWMNPITKPDSPTLDRKNNESLINISNIQLVCHECNTTKGKRTMKDFIKYCNLISTKFNN